MHKFKHKLLATFLAFAISGCGEVTWQKQLPVVSLPNAAPSPKRPSVFLEVRYLYDLSDGEGPRVPVDSREKRFKALVEKVTRESTLFSRISDNPNDVDLKIKIDYLGTVKFNNFIGSPAGYNLTLGLGPLNHNQKWNVKATVTDRSQSIIGADELEDEVVVRLGPLGTSRIVWRDHKVFSEGLENLIKNIYQKMLDDKLLPAP
jgi:hypothetical protein